MKKNLLFLLILFSNYVHAQHILIVHVTPKSVTGSAQPMKLKFNIPSLNIDSMELNCINKGLETVSIKATIKNGKNYTNIQKTKYTEYLKGKIEMVNCDGEFVRIQRNIMGAAIIYDDDLIMIVDLEKYL